MIYFVLYLSDAISQLQSQRQPTGVHQIQQQIMQISDQMNHLKQNLLCIDNNLRCLSQVQKMVLKLVFLEPNICLSFQRILNDLTEYTKICENLIINWTKGELIKWKQQQKTAQYGGPDPLPSLATLTQK